MIGDYLDALQALLRLPLVIVFLVALVGAVVAVAVAERLSVSDDGHGVDDD